jgi:hypothetical protein
MKHETCHHTNTYVWDKEMDRVSNNNRFKFANATHAVTVYIKSHHANDHKTFQSQKQT